MALDQAHALDRLARSQGEKGQWTKAADAHTEASRLFSQAASSTADPSAARTLHLLAQQQTREADAARLKATTQATTQPTTKKSLRRLPTSSIAGSMLDSRSARYTESPGPSPASSVFPEGSYMMLRDDMNSSDPFQRFSRAIDGLLTQVSAPVAFAAMPLSVPRQSDGRRSASTPATPSRAEDQAEPAITESFFIVSPSAPHQPTPNSEQPAFLPKSRIATQGHATLGSGPPHSLASTKTIEELTLENASLKQNLDALSQRFSKLLNDQQRERDSLKHSILTLGKEIKREGDRAVRVPGPTEGGDKNPTISVTEAADPVSEVETLKQELALAKLNAAKYKARYDQLRDAIRKKRSAKEAAADEQSKGAAGRPDQQG